MRLLVMSLIGLLYAQTAIAAFDTALIHNAALQAIDEPGPAQMFQLPDLNGKTLSLAAQRGKVVLLNFWATWCAPCIREMPLLEQLASSLATRPFVVWTVALQQDQATVAPFMAKHKLQLPALLDTDGVVSKLYRLRGLPTTYLIDCMGNLIAWATGIKEWTGEAMQTLLSAMLSEPSCQ